MSRTHLYRATTRARPLTSLLLASAWCGAAVTAMLGTAPGIMSATPVHGAAAALQDRVALVVFASALLIAVTVLLWELVVGRTALRALRLVGAAALLVAGLVGSADAARRVLRPGTPASGAGIAAAAAAPPPAEAPVTAADVEAARDLAHRRLLWTAVGLCGALLVVTGGVAAARDSERSP